MANSGVLASSRFPFAMGKDRLMPGFLGSVSSKFMTPIPAILTTSGLIALAIVYLDVVKIAKLASAFKVLMFIFNELSVIVLRETNAQWYNPSFRSPLPLCSNFWYCKRNCTVNVFGNYAVAFGFWSFCSWLFYLFIIWQ